MKDLTVEELIKIREDLEKIHHREKTLREKGISTNSISSSKFILEEMTPEQINNNWNEIKEELTYDKIKEDSRKVNKRNEEIKHKAQQIFKEKINNGDIDVKSLNIKQLDKAYKDIEESII